MDSYKILRLEEYCYAVVAISYLNPFDDIDEVEVYLKSRDFSGEILFDLLLCNGLNVNRYVQMYFNGDRFVDSSLVLLNDISDDSKKIISDYLKKNVSFMEPSVLPNSQRYLIQNGKVI